MPCAFHLDRVERRRSGCQFELPDDRLTTFAGQTWCPFHLPVEAPGAMSEKAAWPDDNRKIQAFNEEIFAFIRDAKQRSETADLSGTVFPADISFASFSEEDDALPPVLFVQASFGGEAVFTGASFGGEAVFAGATFAGSALSHPNTAFTTAPMKRPRKTLLALAPPTSAATNTSAHAVPSG